MGKVRFRINQYGDEIVVEHFGIEEQDISAEEAIAINSCDIRDSLCDIRTHLYDLKKLLESKQA